MDIPAATLPGAFQWIASDRNPDSGLGSVWYNQKPPPPPPVRRTPNSKVYQYIYQHVTVLSTCQEAFRERIYKRLRGPADGLVFSRVKRQTRRGRFAWTQ